MALANLLELAKAIEYPADFTISIITCFIIYYTYYTYSGYSCIPL